MPKIVNAALLANANIWTLEAKTNANIWTLEAKTKANAVKILTSMPRGKCLVSRITLLVFWHFLNKKTCSFKATTNHGL